MPRREYPRSRRIWMQFTLCIIFAGSVALAQMVVHHRNHAAAEITPGSLDTSFGPVARMTPPPGWVLRGQGKDRSYLIYREPESVGHSGRVLRCRWEQLAKPIPIPEYLQATQIAGRGVNVVIFDNHTDEEFQLDDGVGLLMATSRVVDGQTRVRWIACTIRPDGKAVTLELDCPDSGEPETDKQTLLDTAQSLEFRD